MTKIGGVFAYVEQNLLKLLDNRELSSMHIDYQSPLIQRVWFQLGENRVFLHKLFPGNLNDLPYYHPHPWSSAIRILAGGGYEMGIGHSETIDAPAEDDSTLFLTPGSYYEMNNPNGWHWVKPIEKPSYSLMVIGPPNGRVMPVSTPGNFRKLSRTEEYDILNTVEQYYINR